MQIVDAHVHCNSAQLAIDRIKEIFYSGIDKLAIVSYGHPPAAIRSGESVNTNIHALVAKLLFPGRVFAFGGLNYLPAVTLSADDFAVDLAAQVTQLMDSGFDGIKLLATKPSTYRQLPHKLHSEVFTPFFQEVERRRVPLIWHVGDPATFWNRESAPQIAVINDWCYDESFPSLEELRNQVFTIMARHPKLIVIFAHFFFMATELERLSELFERYPGLHIDITPGTELYCELSAKPQLSREFFIKYKERIIFGTDTCINKNGSFYDPGEQGKVTWMRKFLETDERFDLTTDYRDIQGLKLPQNVLHQIYTENFYRLTARKPIPCSAAKVTAYGEAIVAAVKAAGYDDLEEDITALKLIRQLPT